MKNFFTFLLLTLSFSAKAQIVKIDIQASGLTCSLCSNAINKSLYNIPYVENVRANIKNSTFEVTFKANADVNPDDLKKKVEDAGFFIARMEATVLMNKVAVTDDTHVEMNGKLFHFVHVGERTLQGLVKLQLIDRGFVSAKEYKKNAAYTNMHCYQTGQKEGCCAEKTASKTNRIYHVTI